MDDLKYLIFALLGGLALVTLVQAQDQSGFISLDCGLPEDTSYTEPTLTLRFTSDAAYINSGISKSLSSNYQKVLSRQYHHVRSFPQGRRNCYNISIRRDTKYLMRASFLYGNYDGLGKLPMFDLYFGDSLWRTMNLTDESIDATIDTIYVTSNNQIQICLVNTNNGTPFISSLEFRPLPNETYEVQSRSLLLQIRFDYGTTTNKTYRFPDDIHDRFWVPFSWYEWTSISTMLAIDSGQNNYYQPGSAVMGTAAIRINTSKPLEIWWESDDENTQYYVFMHFAEVEDLKANQTRGFNITYNGNLWYGPLIPNLHDGCKPPIVHRDVKTTNILLTENFQAKLADFGLSKSFPTEGNNTYMSTVVAGTFGYRSYLRYYKSNRLTEKSDVYSFGVALMEIISCRPNSCH